VVAHMPMPDMPPAPFPHPPTPLLPPSPPTHLPSWSSVSGEEALQRVIAAWAAARLFPDVLPGLQAIAAAGVKVGVGRGRERGVAAWPFVVRAGVEEKRCRHHLCFTPLYQAPACTSYALPHPPTHTSCALVRSTPYLTSYPLLLPVPPLLLPC
jgi:hypothetical protein